jgi:UDP-N-acetylmuramoyl-L-alanyl-D-glutamate--2,6-diaminopimelate ligase
MKRLIPNFIFSVYHYCLAFIGAVIYCFPSKRLVVIGITGTSGKSTVAEMLFSILKKRDKTALMSSINFKIGEKEWDNNLKMTMPGRMKIQRFLRQAVRASCKYVILEVTSEGIKQYRHKFIDFDIAIFTNLSPEHIESHGSFEKYRSAKLKLFKKTEVHVVNIDDKNAKFFLDIPAGKKITYSFDDIKLNILGKFNKYNALAAIKTAEYLGFDVKESEKILEDIKLISGRMEIVNENPLVIVDYAHTPEALKSVYETLKDKNLICVLGSCGGGRDKWKRPVMGEIAETYCKQVIVTNEDPYDEDPMDIINQVAPKKSLKILDRKEAIKKAISIAGKDDVVIITGKGCEPWMCVAKGEKIPWSDKQIVLDIVK